MNGKETSAEPVSEAVAKPVEKSQSEGENASRKVPLEALEAERKRRQEAESKANLYEELARRAEEASKQPKKDEEDQTEIIDRKELNKFYNKLTKDELVKLKREISEETFKESKPEAIKAINTHLKEILERKPWLAESIAAAPNRYARAYEIVNDYMPQVAAKESQATEAKKIVENAQKPGSPIGVGKSQQLSGQDYLKSIAGTKEFRDYRKQLLGR